MLGRGRHCRQSLSLHQPKDTDSAAPLIRFGFANTMGDQKRSYRSRGCFCRKLGMCGSLHRASFARAFFGLLRRAEDSSVFMCLTDFDQKSVTYPIVDHRVAAFLLFRKVSITQFPSQRPRACGCGLNGIPESYRAATISWASLACCEAEARGSPFLPCRTKTPSTQRRVNVVPR